MNDLFLHLIMALLPLSALLLIVQVNPYHALVIRGVLGAIAALVDALLGGADVALTEALVGTMLAITLYAVVVRSSLVFRLGMVPEQEPNLAPLLEKLTASLNPHHLRLERVFYPDLPNLQQALVQQEIHALCTPTPATTSLKIRIPRLYEILAPQIASPEVIVTYLDPNEQEKNR